MAEFIDQSFKELFSRPEGASADYELASHIAVLVCEAMELEGMTMNSELTKRILTPLRTFNL